MALNLGALGDTLYGKNEEIAAINAKLKELDTQKREIEGELLAAMQDAGTNIVRGSRATVSISTITRPQLQDFEAFSAFVLKRKALYLFERRIASNAYKEMKALIGNKPIPGVSEFQQTRLNITKL